MQPANWMVHLRDGGERVGINNSTWNINPETDAYEFYSFNGDIEYSIPVIAVKYIQRKHYSGENR
jgi:hypothetical protein